MADGRPTPGASHSPTLLLAEDNPGDARLIEEAASPAFTDGLHIVSTGDAALDFIHQRSAYADAPRPDLILLDWHLPGTDGEEMLAELNDHPDLGPIPVIVLTGSESEAPIHESYTLNANACITKEADPEELEETLRVLEDFWLSAARLPSAVDDR